MKLVLNGGLHIEGENSDKEENNSNNATLYETTEVLKKANTNQNSKSLKHDSENIRELLQKYEDQDKKLDASGKPVGLLDVEE